MNGYLRTSPNKKGFTPNNSRKVMESTPKSLLHDAQAHPSRAPASVSKNQAPAIPKAGLAQPKNHSPQLQLHQTKGSSTSCTSIPTQEMDFITHAAEWSRVIFGVFSFICTFMFLYTLRSHWSSLQLNSSLLASLHAESQRAEHQERIQEQLSHPTSNSNPPSLKALGFQTPLHQQRRPHRRPVIKIVEPR